MEIKVLFHKVIYFTIWVIYLPYLAYKLDFFWGGLYIILGFHIFGLSSITAKSLGRIDYMKEKTHVALGLYAIDGILFSFMLFSIVNDLISPWWSILSFIVWGLLNEGITPQKPSVNYIIRRFK